MRLVEQKGCLEPHRFLGISDRERSQDSHNRLSNYLCRLRQCLEPGNCGLDCSVCPSGTDDPTTTRILTQSYMVAFFNMMLKGESEFATYLTGSEMQSDVDAGLVITQSKNGF